MFRLNYSNAADTLTFFEIEEGDGGKPMEKKEEEKRGEEAAEKRGEEAAEKRGEEASENSSEAAAEPIVDGDGTNISVSYTLGSHI